MAKNYVAPQIEIIKIELEESILSASGVADSVYGSEY